MRRNGMLGLAALLLGAPVGAAPPCETHQEPPAGAAQAQPPPPQTGATTPT